MIFVEMMCDEATSAEVRPFYVVLLSLHGYRFLPALPLALVAACPVAHWLMPDPTHYRGFTFVLRFC